MMWPTDTTLNLLLAGLAVLLYEGLRVLRLGLHEAISLRFCGVVFIWLGYHLTPWLAFLGAPWRSFLLVPEWIDQGLAFTTIAMIAFIAGHALGLGGVRAPARRRGEGYHVSLPLLAATSLAVFTLFIVTVGGFDEAWRSSTGRGAGQFDTPDAQGRLLQMLTVLQSALGVIGACLASLYLLGRPGGGGRILAGVAALVVVSLPMAHQFSRGSGFALIILALLAVHVRRLSGVPVAVAALAAALFLGDVGLAQRGAYPPGIASYAEAVAAYLEPREQRVSMDEVTEADGNPLDAMAPWTRSAQVAAQVGPDPAAEAVTLVLSLSPLPSQIFAPPASGPDLAREMGTVGSVGLTTPALAQAYYAFGFGGAVVAVLLGMVYGHLDRLRLARPGAMAVLCIILGLASLAIGLHSGLRPMTRPLLYALLMYYGTGLALTLLRRPGQAAAAVSVRR